MAQSDASYPTTVDQRLFLKHSSGLTEAGTPGGSAFPGSDLSTGDLRRKYNFAERFSELALEQTPFFRLVSKVAKKPTDDPSFKFTEKRQSWMKRYCYVVGMRTTGDADSFGNAALRNYNDSNTAAANEAIATGDVMKIWVGTDYESAGNIQNVFNQSTGAIAVGDAGTAPQFLLPNQILQINLSATDEGGTAVSGYCLIKISAVGDAEDKSAHSAPDSAGLVDVRMVTGSVVKAASGQLCSYSGDAPVRAVKALDISGGKGAGSLEAMRSYVVGNAYEEGSSLMGQTWKDNPYSTGYGQTQIFRSEFGMTNTARATVLKYEPNEWARVWRDKLIEHKWEIEQTGLFGSQYTDSTNEINYTQGAVDYVSQYGNVFGWSEAKTVDSFMDDMSSYIDPRYNSQKATVYFCSTHVYNWLHKLGGYFKQNLQIGEVAKTSQSDTQLFSADLAITGRKKVLGLDVTKISTPLGDMSVVRNIALDRSNVKILGINMSNVKYRPLVGNGINRDTSIYVGVQSLENTGTDKRVDMILTEAGFEWQMPESHAIWS